MYTLLSGLYRAVTQKDEFFVLILGLDNAGKSTFLESAKAQFTKGKGVHYSNMFSALRVFTEKNSKKNPKNLI
jgi:ADP-ribosylation factor related protein 1